MSRRVVVTGLGVICPLGDSPRAVHAALLAGERALGPVTRFDAADLPCRQAGELRSFEPRTYLGERNLRPLDRLGQVVAATAQLALADAGWTPEELARREMGLVLGTMFCSVHTIAEFDRRGLERGPSYVSPLDFANTVINAAAGQAAIWHALRGVNSTVAGGPAAGLKAIAHAADLIRSGRADALLAGGADELCFESFLAFCRAGWLCGSDPARDGGEVPVPFDARRNGFALAEGAALLLLEEAEAAAARGGRALAEVRGSGEAFDPSRGADGARAARAVARAVGQALAEAGVRPEEVEAVASSASGSVAGDRAEAAGIAAALGPHAAHTAGVPVSALKAMLGEPLGAGGALQALDLVATLGDGRLPGVAGLAEPEAGLPLAVGREARDLAWRSAARPVLACASGFDGQCAALVLGESGA